MLLLLLDILWPWVYVCLCVLASLILQGLQMTVARVPVSQNLCRIMEEVEAWLRGGASGVSLQLDLTSSSSLIHLVSSFMASKLSQLPLSSLHHLAALLLQVWSTSEGRERERRPGQKLVICECWLYLRTTPGCRVTACLW